MQQEQESALGGLKAGPERETIIIDVTVTLGPELEPGEEPEPLVPSTDPPNPIKVDPSKPKPLIVMRSPSGRRARSPPPRGPFGGGSLMAAGPANRLRSTPRARGRSAGRRPAARRGVRSALASSDDPGSSDPPPPPLRLAP